MNNKTRLVSNKLMNDPILKNKNFVSGYNKSIKSNRSLYKNLKFIDTMSLSKNYINFITESIESSRFALNELKYSNNNIIKDRKDKSQEYIKKMIDSYLDNKYNQDTADSLNEMVDDLSGNHKLKSASSLEELEDILA